MQRSSGAALVVGLIMLVLITIMLITALNLGTSSFRSVGNMQFRNEAIAAANVAIEERAQLPTHERAGDVVVQRQCRRERIPGRGDPDLRRCRTGIHRSKKQRQARCRHVGVTGLEHDLGHRRRGKRREDRCFRSKCTRVAECSSRIQTSSSRAPEGGDSQESNHEKS